MMEPCVRGFVGSYVRAGGVVGFLVSPLPVKCQLSPSDNTQSLPSPSDPSPLTHHVPLRLGDHQDFGVAWPCHQDSSVGYLVV
jgi:hypothetical protein